MSVPEQTSAETSSQEHTSEGESAGSVAAPSRPSNVTRTLRRLSYKEGAAALAPGSSSAHAVAVQGLIGPSAAPDMGVADRVGGLTGHDVSHTREHTGPAAQAACDTLGAQAYTVGSDVAYRDPSPSVQLRAHEYTHVAQQTGVPKPGVQAKAVGRGGGDLEAEADAVADAVVQGKSSGPASLAVTGGSAPAVAFKKQQTETQSKTYWEQLKELVVKTRGSQIAQIKDLLDDLTITNNDVKKVLRIHKHLDGPTIVAIMESMSDEMLGDFIDNLNTPHVKAYRREVLECCFAAKRHHFADIDTDVITDMNLDGLSARETLQVGYILRNMGRGDLEDVLEDDNGVKAKEILRGMSGYSKADFIEANKGALEKEQDRAGIKRADSKAMKDAKVKSTAERIADKLDEFHVSDAEATRVLSWLTSLRKEKGDAVIGTVARYLEDKKRLDRFMEELPSDARWAGAHAQTFLLVVAARPPEKNLLMAEDLLSYGIFDWAITDAEAKLAYYLVKSMPPSVQDAFRRSDSGKWFIRMDQQQSDEMVTSGEYHGVEVKKDEDGNWEDVAEKHAAKLAEAPVKQRFDRLVSLAEKMDAETAMAIYVDLGATKDRAAVEAIVRRLDSLGYVEALFDELGHAILFAERNRARSLRIMSARDPQHLMNHAREVLSLGVFDWAVTSEEAFLAFHLIKGLPKEERDAFMKSDNGAWWAAVQSEMSVEMRGSDATTFYDGGKGNDDRDRVRAELMEDAIWSDKSKLDGYTRMAQLGGDGEWLFNESKRREAYKSQLEVVLKRGLYHPEKIPEYKPEIVKGTNYLQEGPLGLFGTIGAGIGLIHNSEDVETANYLGGTGLSAPDLQEVMGGDIFGVRLQGFDQLGEEGKQAKKDKKGANYIDAKYDMERGVLDVTAPDLRIESINKFVGTTKITSGQGTITGLDVSVRYPTAHNPAPAYAEVHCAEAVINDIALVHEESIQTASKLKLTGPAKPTPMFKLGTPGITKADLIKARDTSRIPIPIVGGVLSAITNIVDVVFYSEDNANEMMNGFTDPRSPMQVELNIAGIDVEGVNLSHGQSIKSLSFKDIKMGGGQSRGAYLRAKIKSLDAAIERYALAGKADKATESKTLRTKLAEELTTVEPKEARVQTLLAEYHQDPAGFTKREELEKLQTELGTNGGLVVDIGEISAKGIDGAASADDVTLKNLHGEGSAGLAGISVMTNPTLLDSVAGGSKLPREEDPNAGLPGSLDVSAMLSVDEVAITNLRVKAGIPRLAELDEAIAALEKRVAKPKPAASDRKQLAELKQLRPQIVQYEAYRAKGLTELTDKDRSAFQKLHAELDARLALQVESLNLTGASVALAASKGGRHVSATVGAETLDARGVKSASGIEVDHVTGKGIEASVGAGGLGAAMDLEKLKDVNAGVKAESLTFEGARSRDHGVEVKRAHIEGLDASATDLTGDASAHIKTKVFEVEGINLTAKVRLMEAEYDGLVAKGETLDDTQKARKTKLEQMLGEHKILRDRVAAAEQALVGAKKSGEGVPAAAKALEDAQKALETWSQIAERVAIKDVDLLITGLGDVTADDYDPMKHGFKVSGGGKGGRMIGSIEADGVRTESGSAESFRAENLTGELDISSKRIGFKKVGLGSVRVSGLDYSAGGTRAQVTGSAGLNGLEATGSVTFREVPNKTTGEMEMQPDVAELERFDIVSVDGTGIDLDMKSRGMHIGIPKGSLRGVWAEGFKITFPEKEGGVPKMQGAAGLKAMDLQLRADLTESLGYRGTLSGSEMSVDFASDGTRTVDVGNLDAHGVVTSAQGSAIKVDLTGLSGSVIQKGDSVQLKDVELGDFTLGKGGFKGDGLSVDVGGQMQLKTVYVDAEFKTTQKGGKTELENVIINTLRVKEINAQDVHAVQDAVAPDADKGVEGHQRRKLDLVKATILGLRADGIDMKAKKGNLHVPKADVTGLHVALGEAGKETLKATASLSARELDMKMLGPDHQLIDFGKGVNLSAHIEKDGVDARVTVDELTGKVERIGDTTMLRGIKLDKLGFGECHISGGGKQLDIGKKADFSGIYVDAQIATRKVGSGKDEKTEITKLLLTKVIVQRIDAEDISGSLAAVEEDKSKGIEASKEKRVSLKKGTIEWLRMTDLDLVAMTGNVHVDKTDLTGLGAAVGPKGSEALKLTNGTLNSTGLDLTMKGPGGKVIDFGKTTITGRVQTEDGVDAKIDAKDLQGKATLRDDGATLTGVSLGAFNLPYAKYEANGTTVECPSGLFANPVTLGQVDINYTEPDAHGNRKIASIIVTDLVIPEITSPTVKYTGLAETVEDGKSVRKETTLRLRKVTLTDFHLLKLDRNMLTKTTKADVDVADIAITRVRATLKKKVGDAETVATLATKVAAKGLEARVTASTVEEDGKPTTKTTGTATLDHLGLSKLIATSDGTGITSSLNTFPDKTGGLTFDKDGDKKAVAIGLNEDGSTDIHTGKTTAKNFGVDLGKGHTIDLWRLTSDGGHAHIGADGKPEWAVIPELRIGSEKKNVFAPLTYTDPKGLTAHVSHGTAKGVRAEWKDGVFHKVHIDTLQVDKGRVDMDKKYYASSSDKDAGGDIDIPHMPILESVSGDLTFEFWWQYDPWWSPAMSNTEKLKMSIDKGVFDAQAFENEFSWRVDWFAFDIRQDGNEISLALGSDPVTIQVDDDARDKFKDAGKLDINTFMGLVEKYANVVKDKPSDPDLMLPMEYVKMYGALTVAAGAEIDIPGGKVKVGQMAGGAKNAIDLRASPSGGVKLNLTTFAFESIDWKSSAMSLSTGQVEFEDMKVFYGIKSGGVVVDINKRATFKDFDLTF